MHHAIAVLVKQKSLSACLLWVYWNPEAFPGICGSMAQATRLCVGERQKEQLDMGMEKGSFWKWLGALG